MITNLTSRELIQDVSGAKKAANNDPIIIIDQGSPAHVLLSIEEYHRLTGNIQSIVDLLAMPNTEDIGFEPPKLSGKLFKPVDLS